MPAPKPLLVGLTASPKEKLEDMSSYDPSVDRRSPGSLLLLNFTEVRYAAKLREAKESTIPARIVARRPPAGLMHAPCQSASVKDMDSVVDELIMTSQRWR